MNIRKLTLVSNNLCYGPEPKIGEEIEQRLTIHSKGGVWFCGYGYNRGNYPVCRSKSFSISEYDVQQIFHCVALYFETNSMIMDATDMGEWELTITEANGAVKKYTGSLNGGMEPHGANLTTIIRHKIPIEQLFVFDGPFDHLAKIERLEALLDPQTPLVDTFYEMLEEIDAIKRNYHEYMISSPINADEELKRLPSADYDLCCALLTMLLREDHFCNGSFIERFNKGDVSPIVKKMIDLLKETVED